MSSHTSGVEGERASTMTLRCEYISIHTRRVEGDGLCVRHAATFVISIHTLRVEGDQIQQVARPLSGDISIHTLRVEGDSKSAQKSRTLLFKVTDLRRNCRPDVHERTEGSLWQAVFAG